MMMKINQTLIAIFFLFSILAAPAYTQSIYSVDESRGEWTLMVIPDTQGYIEDWTEEGYEYKHGG